MSLHHPSEHFTLHRVFSPVNYLVFGVWGTPGPRGHVGGVKLVLRTFPELAGRSMQNLVEIGPAVKRGHRFKPSLLYIEIDARV